MKSKIILVGGGGHCKSCIDVIEKEARFEIAGIIDVYEKLGQTLLGYRIIGTDSDLPGIVRQYRYVLISLGQIKSPGKRIDLFERLAKTGARFATVVSPLAYVSRHAQLEEGTIVMHHALVNGGARIGKNCIINTKALIEHDADVGDNCHIATGAIINGGVDIGAETFVGSQAMVRQSVSIGKKCVIGAGSIVVKNVPSNSTIKASYES